MCMRGIPFRIKQMFSMAGIARVANYSRMFLFALITSLVAVAARGYCRSPSALAGMDVLIPCLPGAAWRLLMEMLLFERGFCHAVTPYFHTFGDVTLYVSRKPLHVLRGEHVAGSKSETVRSERRRRVLAIRE